jgi:hypothetical protein
MTDVSAYLIKILTLLRKDGKRLGKTKISLTSALVILTMAVAGTLLGTRYLGSNDKPTAVDQNTSASAPPSAPSEAAVQTAVALPGPGGLDVRRYCRDMGFTGQEVDADIYCYKPVDLTAACQDEYPDKAETINMLPGDPNSGSCRDADGNDLGGISNMIRHCRTTYNKISADQIEADTKPGNIWHCRAHLDPSAVCIAQYNDRSLKARHTTAWECVRA